MGNFKNAPILGVIISSNWLVDLEMPSWTIVQLTRLHFFALSISKQTAVRSNVGRNKTSDHFLSTTTKNKVGIILLFLDDNKTKTKTKTKKKQSKTKAKQNKTKKLIKIRKIIKTKHSMNCKKSHPSSIGMGPTFCSSSMSEAPAYKRTVCEIQSPQT